MSFSAYLLEIRGTDGHLGVLATHIPEFAAALRTIIEQAGYETKTKTQTMSEELK